MMPILFVTHAKQTYALPMSLKQASIANPIKSKSYLSDLSGQTDKKSISYFWCSKNARFKKNSSSVLFVKWNLILT